MNMDHSRLIARFQRLVTEILIEKRLGQRRPELTDEFYQTWLEVEQRGLKKAPEYRNVLLRADRHAFWLARLVRLVSPDTAPLLSSKETEAVATLSLLLRRQLRRPSRIGPHVSWPGPVSATYIGPTSLHNLALRSSLAVAQGMIAFYGTYTVDLTVGQCHTGTRRCPSINELLT